MVQAGLYGGLAALQLAGGYFAAQNIKETAELNQDISNMNAKYAELDAWDAENEGFSAQARYQSVIDSTLADQEVMLAAQDVDTSYGTNAALKEETRFIGELNKMEIEKQAQERAMGFRTQARDIRLGGALEYGAAQTKAGAAMFSGITSAAQTGLTGYDRSR